MEVDEPASLGADEQALVPGAPNRILLTGTVIGPDGPYQGQVLVENDRITCARPGAVCAERPGAVNATRFDTGGVIAPGLIDTHNHILFDIFDDDDWMPAHLYQNHNQWPNEAKYQAMLDVKQCLADDTQGKPAWCPAHFDGPGSLRCEMDKWGEIKALISGTTSVVGLPGTSSACFGSITRSIDSRQNDLGLDRVQTSAIFPPAPDAADRVCRAFQTGAAGAYLIHVGEGIDDRSRREFDKLISVSSQDGCLLAPQTSITHGTAFTSAQFDVMAEHGVKLTWSPRSNVSLYGATADIPTAVDAGVLISLAPDWSMGGSINLLSELRYANAWDDEHWGNTLSARDLVDMTTRNPAETLSYDDRLGTIEEGLLADLIVVPSSQPDPYDAVVTARPENVALTMIGGQALYGDAAIAAMAPVSPGCERLDVCGVSKFICVAESTTSAKLGQTLGEIQHVLQGALAEVDGLTPDGWNFAPLSPLFQCQ